MMGLPETMKRLTLILSLVLAADAAMAQNPLLTNEGNGVYPLKRLEHFYSTRTFPDGVMPPGGAQAAFDAAKKMPTFEFGINQRDLAPDWEFFGPDQTDVGWLARVHAIAMDPTNTNVIYSGSAKGGLWKSTNGGTTWANITDTLSSQTVGAVTLDPQNPNIVLMGTGEEYYSGYTWSGVGLFRSTNGGSTWTQLGASTFSGSRIGDLAIAPTNSALILVGSDFGLYRTTNTGATFTQMISGRCNGVVFHPTNNNIAYASVSGKGVYRSNDAGATWTLLSNGIPTTILDRTEITISRSNPSVLYAVSHNPAGFFRGVWKTTDGGTTWAQLTSAPNGGASFTWYCIGISVSPTDPNVCLLLGQALYKTTNGGTTWTEIAPDHPDMHAAQWYPGSSTSFLLGQDAGLYKSTNQGTSYTKLNFGRGTMEYYDHASHPTNASIIGAGSQDNGTHFRLSGNNTWTYKTGGDGFRVAFRADNPNIILTESQYAFVYRSTNGGASFGFIYNPSGGNWNSPLYNNPANPAHFFVGTTSLHRSTDGSGGGWASIASGFGSSISDIAMRSGDVNTMYLGTYGGSVFKSTNVSLGSPTFANVTSTIVGAISGIAITPGNSNDVWVTTSRATGAQVFRTTNGGTTWAAVNGNLPSTPATGVAINPFNTAQIFISTDSGVFTTTNGGTTWARFGTRIPTGVGVSGIEANGTTGYLTVSTYGRSVWRIPLPRSVSLGFFIDYEGDASVLAHPIRISFRDPGQTAELLFATVSLTDGGQVNVGGIPNGFYDVAITSGKYLRRTFTNVNLSASNGSLGTAFMRVGDIDGDNEVSILDYLALSAAYGTANAASDLDWDGEVSILDYILLSSNSGLLGDD